MPSTVRINRPRRVSKSCSSDNETSTSKNDEEQSIDKKKQNLDNEEETDTDDNSRRELKPCHDDNDEKTSSCSDVDVTSSSSSPSSIKIKVHQKDPQPKTDDSIKSKVAIKKEEVTVVRVRSTKRKITKTIRFGDDSPKKSKPCIKTEPEDLREVAVVGVRSTQRKITKSVRYGDDFVCDLNTTDKGGNKKKTPGGKPGKVLSWSTIGKATQKQDENKQTSKKRKASEMGSSKLLVEEFGKKRRDYTKTDNKTKLLVEEFGKKRRDCTKTDNKTKLLVEEFGKKKHDYTKTDNKNILVVEEFGKKKHDYTKTDNKNILLVEEFGKKKHDYTKTDNNTSISDILSNDDNLQVLEKLRNEQIEIHTRRSIKRRKLKTTDDTSSTSAEKPTPTESQEIKQNTVEISPNSSKNYSKPIEKQTIINKNNQKRKMKDLDLSNNKKIMHMDSKNRRDLAHKRAHKPKGHVLGRSLKKLSKWLPLHPPVILPPVSYASLSLSNAPITEKENERVFESVIPWEECDLKLTHRFLQAKLVLGRDVGVKFCEDVLGGWKRLPDCESLQRHMAAMWCIYAHLLLQQGELQSKVKLFAKGCIQKQAKERKEERRRGWPIPKGAAELRRLLQGLTEAKVILERAVKCPMASRLSLVWIVRARMMEMEGVVRATLMRLECDGGTSVDWFEFLSRGNRRAREILNQGLDITPVDEASVHAAGGCVIAQGISNIEERHLVLKELHRLTDNFICASQTMAPPNNPLVATTLLKPDSPLPTTTDQIIPPPTSYNPPSSPVTPPPPDADSHKSPTPIPSPSPLFFGVEHLCPRCSRIIPIDERCPHCTRKFRGDGNILRQNYETKTSYKLTWKKKASAVKSVNSCRNLKLTRKKKVQQQKILVVAGT